MGTYHENLLDLLVRQAEGEVGQLPTDLQTGLGGGSWGGRRKTTNILYVFFPPRCAYVCPQRILSLLYK